MRKVIIALILLFSLPLLGQEDEAGFVVLPEEQVHSGDYFAIGGSCEISGTVQGDLFVIGSQILIDGVIEGDVIASGATIQITGSVQGSARLMGGQIDISGQIGKNLTAFGANVDLGRSGQVKGNSIIHAGLVDFAGTTGKNLTLSASSARLLGHVGQNVKGVVGKMRIGSRAYIGGDLAYKSSQEAQIDSGAEIMGSVAYEPSAVRHLMRGRFSDGFVLGSRLVGFSMNFVYSFFLGWLFIKVWPKKLERTVRAIKGSPVKSFFVGLCVVFFLPLVCLLLLITILGFPLALGLLAVSLLTFYAAKIFPIIWLSNHVFAHKRLKQKRLLVLFFGLIVFFLLAAIPVLGKILSITLTFIGLGGIALGRLPKKKKTS